MYIKSIKYLVLGGCLITCVACFQDRKLQEEDRKLQEIRLLSCNIDEQLGCQLPQTNIENDKYSIDHNKTDISEILKKFNGSAVKDYSVETINKRSSLEMYVRPQEFDDVVRAGKIIVPLLIQNLDNNDDFLKFASLEALQSITKRSFEYSSVYTLLRRKKTVDKQEWIKCKSEWMSWWEKNKDRARVQWLVDAIKENDLTIILAVNELGQLGDRSVIPFLRTILNEQVRIEDKTIQKMVKEQAIRALGMLGDEYVIPYIIDGYLKNDLEQYRCQGIAMLWNITGETLCYDPKASITDREEKIKLWEYWWEKNKKNYEGV